MTMRLNLNDVVRVKLTGNGMLGWLAHWKKVGMTAPKPDAYRYFHMQFWYLCQIFGHDLQSRKTQLFVQNEICVDYPAELVSAPMLVTSALQEVIRNYDILVQNDDDICRDLDIGQHGKYFIHSIDEARRVLKSKVKSETGKSEKDTLTNTVYCEQPEDTPRNPPKFTWSGFQPASGRVDLDSPYNTDLLSCDCHISCWQHHAQKRNWPYLMVFGLPDFRHQDMEDIVPYGAYVMTNNPTRYLIHPRYFQSAKDGMRERRHRYGKSAGKL
jgi:hypothetical protein